MPKPIHSTQRSTTLAWNRLVDHPLDRDEEVQMHFRLHPDQEQKEDAKRFLGRLASQLPHDRRHLDHGEIRERFGAKDAALEAVAKSLGRLGFEVTDTDGLHRDVGVKAPLGAVEKALDIEIRAVHRGGQVFRSFCGPVRLHDDLANRVVDVRGLDTVPSVLPRTHSRPFSADHYAVREVAEIYGCPLESTGKGQTVVILALGGGYHPQDLHTYFKGIGLDVPTVIDDGVNGAVNQPASSEVVQSLLKAQSIDSVPLTRLEAEDGASDMVDAMWTVEVTSDVQVLGSMVPDAKIVVIFAANNPSDEVAAMRRALSPGFEEEYGRPTVISCSWGKPEASVRESSRDAFEEELSRAAALGVTVCCASGDSGGGFVYYPASSPFAVGCGGTAILTPPSRSKTEEFRETVWRERREDRFFSSSGGGLSDVFPAPTWQQSAVAKWSTRQRGVPDLAAQASLATGYSLVIGNARVGIGGTSVAAPLIAGLVGQIIEANSGLAKDYRIGWLTPLLYRPEVAPAFCPIDSGSNGLYSAYKNWDPCSGLGRPNGQALCRALAGLKAPKPAASAPRTVSGERKAASKSAPKTAASAKD